MEKLKVLVRIRPPLPNENSASNGIDIDPDNPQRIVISKSLKRFDATFDKILDKNSTQKQVFNFIKSCMKFIKQGINCTILAYGQTGSGKTYTMFGGEWAMNNESTDYDQRKKFNKDKYNFILNDELTIDPFSETNGIIPNLIMSLFKTYGTYDSNGNNIIITCSYIQIYNEQVYDLLVDEEEKKEEKKRFNLESRVGSKVNERPINQKPLKIKYDKKNGVTIDGVNEIRTPTFYDIFELLREGEINRKIRQTKRNEMSSRSHTIFIINIQNLKTNVISKIKLCDLAGSERYDSRESYKKLHFSEMCNINKSLLILGNVIHSLGNSNSSKNLGSTKNKKNQKTFIPYRDSKLTQILEDSLGGNSMTYLIATISPCDENFEETLSTLKFADRAHSIMSKVSMNQLTNNDESYKSKEFNKIYDELFQLKQLLNIRRKRGTLEPIQEELLKLKDENSQLKKYLGGRKNINRIQELMEENNNLKKEIKNLTEMNKSLKKEIKNNPKIPSSYDRNSNENKKNKILERNKTDANLNNLYSNDSKDNKYNLINSKSGSYDDINDFDKNSEHLKTLKESITYQKDENNNNNKNNNNKNKNAYNKYDVDDNLDNNYEDNYNNKNLLKSKSSRKNVLLESGKNIIYGNNDTNNNKKLKNENNISNNMGEEYNNYDDLNNMDSNYNDFDYNIDDNDYNNKYLENNTKNNDINSNNVNPKTSKLNNATPSYELNLLDQLELENKKKTQEEIDNLIKNRYSDI